VALMPEDDFEAATLAVARGAAAASAPDVWINSAQGNPVAATIDGRRFALRGEKTLYRPADPAAFVEALRNARRAALIDAQGKALAPLSTAGASAALLYMDEKQGRIGTVTALARRGDKSASAVPAPPPLPVILSTRGAAKPPRKLTPAQLRKARGESACEDASQEQAPGSFRLDARYTLVLVPLACGSGAYNFLSVALLVDDAGRVLPVPFERIAGARGVGDDNMIYNSDWDPKVRRLGTYFNERGIGDCGTTQAWAWDGTRFRLAEQSEMGECRGSLDYITTWRAVVR
jgi:hypothetical protein